MKSTFTIFFLLITHVFCSQAFARKLEIVKAGDVLIISSIGCCEINGKPGYRDKGNNCIQVSSCSEVPSVKPSEQGDKLNKAKDSVTK